MSSDKLSLDEFLNKKRFDFGAVEPLLRQYWSNERIYEFKAEDSRQTAFLIDTPPPYANGKLHFGHGMSYTQLDIIARYQRQRRPTLLPLAFDDNGLPTERFTEKKYEIQWGEHPDNFFDLCLEEASAAIEAQIEQFDRLGFSYNHKVSYRTIDELSTRITQKNFIDLYNRGIIKQTDGPQIYCTRCQTALAQADLETQTAQTDLHYIRFPSSKRGITVGTTRPELIPAAVAIFYHPDDPGFDPSLEIRNPITDQILPILSDHSIDQSYGSGIMMCATFGDQEDIELYRTHGLPLIQLIDRTGKMTSEAGKYEGLDIPKARREIIQDLKDSGQWESSENITHSFPTCERCNSPTEILPSDQWTLDIMSIQSELLEYIDQINFHPSYMKKRLINWIAGLKWDWIISRQRIYGIPIPIWECDDCGYLETAKIEDLPLSSGDMAEKSCPQCAGRLCPDGDIFDTWMTSSLTPQILNHLYHSSDHPSPLSIRSQAHEIIRTWAFYTIIKAYLDLDLDLPWEDLLISGWGLGFSAKGKRGIKASKSKNNARDPANLIDEFGADAFRYWAASAKLGKDQYLKDAILFRGKKLATKMYNAIKLGILLLRDNDTSIDHDDQELIENLESQISTLHTNYESLMDEFDYSSALSELEQTFWNDFCSELLEDFKSIGYARGLSARERLALYTGLQAYLRMFAPFMPFISEYLQLMLFHISTNTTYRSIHTTSNPILSLPSD